MIIEIDGAKVNSVAEFHSWLANALDLGSYYRPNLAALWDILSVDIERPIRLVWRDSELSRRAMGDSDFSALRDVLLRVQAQDEGFNLEERFVVLFE